MEWVAVLALPALCVLALSAYLSVNRWLGGDYDRDAEREQMRRDRRS